MCCFMLYLCINLLQQYRYIIKSSLFYSYDKVAYDTSVIYKVSHRMSQIFHKWVVCIPIYQHIEKLFQSSKIKAGAVVVFAHIPPTNHISYLQAPCGEIWACEDILFILLNPNLKNRNLRRAPSGLVCYWPGAVWTLVRFVPRVDLPVSVETAGVGQQLTALLALHTGLPIGADFPRLNAA